LDAHRAGHPDDADTLIIVRSLGPDRFFTAEQRQRLEQLMARWRSTRDASESRSDDESSRALACRSCNLCKPDQIEGLDWVSGELQHQPDAPVFTLRFLDFAP